MTLRQSWAIRGPMSPVEDTGEFSTFSGGKHRRIVNILRWKTPKNFQHSPVGASGCWGQVAASGCKWLLWASGCKWLQVAASGCKWLLKWLLAASGCSSGCSSGCKWLRGASGCKWLLLPNSKYASYARSLEDLANAFGPGIWMFIFQIWDDFGNASIFYLRHQDSSFRKATFQSW